MNILQSLDDTENIMSQLREATRFMERKPIVREAKYDFQCSTSVAMSLPSRYSRFHHQKLHTLAGSKLSGSRRVRSWERSLISASFETLIKPNVITKLKKKHNQSLDFKLEGMMKLEIRIFEIKHSIKQYLLKAYNHTSPIIRVADLGCATGSNTFDTVDIVVETLRRRYTAVYGGVSPEFEAFFCDLPCNDFNMLFRLLTEKQKVASSKYFAGGVAGSFYDRLFPRGTIHVAVSLSALHWLSQIPEKVLEKGSRTWNKGKTWVEGAKKEVVDAYAEQSDKDLDDFLKCQKAEMVKGGVLFVLMTDRPSGSSSQFV
ncbi:unnamed protein product [Brassica oleracea]